MVKKYGFIPSKPQLISSSSDSDSSSCDEEQGSMFYLYSFIIWCDERNIHQKRNIFFLTENNGHRSPQENSGRF